MNTTMKTHIQSFKERSFQIPIVPFQKSPSPDSPEGGGFSTSVNLRSHETGRHFSLSSFPRRWEERPGVRGKRMTDRLRLPAALAGAGLVVASIFLTAGKSASKYAAHEWGTFTSVQGGDGVLLDWRPLETSRLPNFVYNWKKPGLSRQPAGALAPRKDALTTLQRIET